MGAAPMNDNVVEHEVPMDRNYMFLKQEEVTNRMVGGGQGSRSFEEDGTRCNEAPVDVKDGPRGAIQVHETLQISQQPQGAVVRWERFLPFRSLKVLLVEDDDSTRHVVSALLRNCSYEVMAVSNGLQAWKTLENPDNHIDLILTEVVMPFLSGVSLLSKIMTHKSFKNIPVIMMSSHDSMGIVFKCLSKGAVDFLLKPIRKNELKNLWQHVWRRCHSSSSSGSESGTNTRKSSKSKSNDASESNTDSSDEIDHGSNSGSGSQSSWTKWGAEVESSPPLSAHDQMVDAPDSICAQVIHAKTEKACARWRRVAENECHKQGDQLDSLAMGKDLEIGVSRHLDLHPEHTPEKLSAPPTERRINISNGLDDNHLNNRICNALEKGRMEFNCEISTTERNQTLNSVSAIVKCMNGQVESKSSDGPKGPSEISQTKASCSETLPSFKLNLKKLGGADPKNVAGDECNVLRHSDLSAFLKYNNASSGNQAQTGNVGSCSPLDNSSVALNPETVQNFPSHSNGMPNHQSNGSSDNDMASTNRYMSPTPQALNKQPESAASIVPSHSSAFQRVQNHYFSSKQQTTPKEEDSDTVIARFRVLEEGNQVKHNHHELHQYCHNAGLELYSGQNHLSLEDMATTAPQHLASNVLAGPIESNAGNYTANRSASMSDIGSNEEKRSNTPLTTGMVNLEVDKKATGSSEGSGISRKNSGVEADEGCFDLREDALAKLRQKRKERCFEKRVQYHSRKKLAEQRPHVRRQFVGKLASHTKEERVCLSNNMISGDNSPNS